MVINFVTCCAILQKKSPRKLLGENNKPKKVRAEIERTTYEV